MKGRNEDQCENYFNITNELALDVIATFTTTDNARICDMIKRLSGKHFTGSFLNFNDKGK